MTRPLLLDTGPLVAYLSRREPHHQWAIEQFEVATAPLWTCEAVLSEACFLVRKLSGGVRTIMTLYQRGVLNVSFRFAEESAAVAGLLSRYADIPMSFADACLVRMAELSPRSAVLTLDSDFKVYRKNGRQSIPVVMPEL